MIAEVHHLSGVVPVLPTPFNDDETIDFGSIPAIMKFAEAAGCTTVCLPAFGSEFYKLSPSERSNLLDMAFASAGSLRIIVQCNHASPKNLRSLINEAEARGAFAINAALPRMMPVSEDQLLGFAETVCESTSLPVVIQDYNPGGPIVGINFATELSKNFSNFRFIKYEVPGIGPLVKDILIATSGKVRVLSGWGGSYILEQIPAGIAGIMPGIPLADYFNKIWQCAIAEQHKQAMSMFADITPYLLFSLQNLEMFHHAEKQLAVRRGIIARAVVRRVTVKLNKFENDYLRTILDHTCDSIERYGFKLNINK